MTEEMGMEWHELNERLRIMEEQSGEEVVNHDSGERLMITDATLRDYFAAAAISGVLSENGGYAICEAIVAGNPNYGQTTDGVAKTAYEIADALIEARDA